MDSLVNTDDDAAFAAKCVATGVRLEGRTLLGACENAAYLARCDERLARTVAEELRDVSQELLGMASSGEITFADADAAYRFRTLALQIRGRRFTVISGGRA